MEDMPFAANGITEAETLANAPSGTKSPHDGGVETESNNPPPEMSSEELPVPKRDISDLRNPLPNLLEMRRRLFEVRETIELKVDEFERYWPYVDNVWVRQHRAGTDKSGRITTDYYACRLQRPTYTPRKAPQERPDGKPLRKKQTREGGTCQMRIKAVRYEGGFSKYTITKVGAHEHTHDLDHMDSIKRNTVVMEIARAEVMKGFMPASVFTIMSEDEAKLAAAGGRHLNRNDVRNASQSWRQTHRDALNVHPGYKYDHGNGIVRDESFPPPPIPQAAPDLSMLDPALVPSPPLPTPPTSTSTSLLPPNALHFPPQTASLLDPYLPPTDTALSPGSLPFVTLTYATSLDSFLAIAPGTQTHLSGPGSKALTHYLRAHHDAILIGVGTALTDNPTLNCRLAGAGGYGGVGWDSQPRPIIIDPGARWLLTPDSAVLRAVAEGRGKAPWIIIAPGFAIDPARLELLKYYGGKYVGLPELDKKYRLSWEGIFRALAAEGIRSVMVEGGGVVINELLQPEYKELIRSVVVTVAPTYLGTGGVVVCPSRNLDELGRPRPVVRFRDVRWVPLGEDVVMCGRLGNGEANAGERGQVNEVEQRVREEDGVQDGQEAEGSRGMDEQGGELGAANNVVMGKSLTL